MAKCKIYSRVTEGKTSRRKTRSSECNILYANNFEENIGKLIFDKNDIKDNTLKK